jgi:hypothetical protein
MNNIPEYPEALSNALILWVAVIPEDLILVPCV